MHEYFYIIYLYIIYNKKVILLSFILLRLLKIINVQTTEWLVQVEIEMKHLYYLSKN